MGINDFPTGVPKTKVEMSSNTIEHVPPELGGTLMIMQRHGDYDRETGHLTDQGEKNALERSRRAIEHIVNQIPPEERQRISVLVVASPTIRNEGQRSMETASAVIKSVQDVFEENGILKENIFNDSPRPVEDIEAPRILKDNSGFLQFLEGIYGTDTKKLLKPFEEDVHREEREKRGAEGPIEMSNRFAHFTNVLARYARMFHLKNKDKPRRLIIWNVSHYDTITVFFKNHVAGIDQKEYIPVDYDGGMSLVIDPQNQASITVSGKTYPVDLGLNK
jgi:hypothetical protein